MSTHRKLLTVCCAAVLAFVLAACGSSDDDMAAMTPMTPMTPAAQDGPDVAGLLLTAHNSRTAAETAEMAAAQAVKDAVKYSTMFTTLAALGDSMMAEANAQKVLGAKAAADQAVIDAEAAKTALETAKTEAGGIPADDPNRAAVMDALDAAIEAADDAVKEATKSAEELTLEAAYKAVIVDAKKPKTAADHGKAAAMDVGGALMPGTDGARGTRAPHVATAAPSGDKTAVRMNDAEGKTFVQIVGEDKVMMSRLAEDNTNVPVASIAGMTASEVHADLTEDTYADATNQADSTYKGIPGTAHCLGTDCKVAADKLAGSWYFEPAEPMHVYLKSATTKRYERDQMFAQFGYWLTPGDDGIIVNTYAFSGTMNTGAWGLNTAPEETTLLDKTATYSGTAAGMSLHKTVDADNVITSIYSGGFTADVTLDATFHATAPLLGGTVDNFQGNAVDPRTGRSRLWRRRRPVARLPQAGLRQRPAMPARGRQHRMAKKKYARRVSSAASAPTSRTAMQPERTLLGRTSNRTGVLNPNSSEGRPLCRPSLSLTTGIRASRDSTNNHRTVSGRT